MMGAEPLEVPHQSSTTEHQHQQNSLIAPSTLVEDGCWDSNSSKHSLSQQHHHQVNGGQGIGGGSISQGSSSTSSSGIAGANKGARRTRHRVDAGEPRGCFNSASNPGFGFQPARNIFTSPLSQQKSLGSGSPLVAIASNNPNNSPNTNSNSLSPFHLHHHHPSPHHFLHHPNSYFPPGFNNKGHLNPESQDSYYFQPMKMLNEYITSQQAQVAAAAAAAAAMANTPPTGQNGSVPHQLLLREMLSKSSRNNNNNNNNNVTKCGYEEDVVSVMEQQSGGGGSENNRPEVEKEDSDLRDDSIMNARSIPGSGSGGAGRDNADANELPDSEDDDGSSVAVKIRSRNLKPVKLETLMENGGSITKGHPIIVNGHRHSVEVGSGSASSSVTSGNSGAAIGGMRINGCKKRKLYQPQQRSDFDEVDEEEELDDEEYDANVSASAITRSKRLKESGLRSPPNLGSGSGGHSPLPPVRDDLLAQEEDDEEEMRMMDMKSDQHEYDDDQFDDEDDLVTSNRTTPNVIPGGGIKDERVNSVNAAPLTRQLLTERSTNKEHGKASPNSLSILRTSSSPKIMMMNNGMNQPTNLRRTREAGHQEMFVDLPFGAGVGPNPAAYFYQWKENFKSTLITHINELVDTQFSLLFPGGQQGNQAGGGGNTTGGRNPGAPNIPNPNHPPQNHHQHHHRDSPKVEKLEKTQFQQKNPASLLLNGGTVCNNSNNREREREREMSSPPQEKMARLDRNSNFPSRFPFQVAGNVPREREPIMNNNNNNGNTNTKLTLGQLQQQHQHQQNFSTALMGLNAQMQHHQAAVAAAAAAAAAGMNSDMFENDAPISLVVNRDQLTPRKRRHKVTDTRLTPRAVSRLLGQVDSYGGDLSPQREGRTPPPMSTTSGGHNSLPTSVAIPNPSLSDSARLFTPYAHPLFGHHPPPGNHHRMGSSPPMGIHPALLANPAEYVQQLRAEMQEQRNGELSLLRERDNGRSEHVRAVRDNGSMLPVVGNDRGGNAARPGSVGSDSGETNSFGGDLPCGSIYSVGASHPNYEILCLRRTTSRPEIQPPDFGHGSSTTLTPMHLRKAKLMFFWVRYPSSSVIKMYFPDIKFNKNNTAQLVKWFSNFREFYYIQMEKYARQALSESIKNAEDLHVTVENELYRVLNLHYNRNNHIEVPSNFRYVVEQTLREFFKAIQQGKDQEQSWKKAIYKIIARLDDPVPEYFKSPNFLEQLE